MRARIAALPPADVARDLSEAVLVNAGNDPELLAAVAADPAGVLGDILDLLDRYWEAAFAVQWRTLEPYEVVADRLTALGAAVHDLG